MRPRRFGHHTLAVLAAAMLGSTGFSLAWTAGLAVAMGARLPGFVWLATMAMLFWLAVFIIALPSAAIVLSLLWPVTRRGTVAANWICILGGTAAGLILAPLASHTFHGATPLQLAFFAGAGAAIAACYLAVAKRLGRDRHSAIDPSIFAA